MGLIVGAEGFAGVISPLWSMSAIVISLANT